MRIWWLSLGPWGLAGHRTKCVGPPHSGHTARGEVHQGCMPKPFLAVNSIADSPALLESLGAVIIE